jgi:hypothetical protein
MKAIHVVTLALALVLVAGLALAQGTVGRPREVLSGGASESAAGGVSLRGTLGQPVVGAVSSSGGDLTLAQGFWHGAAQVRIYLPLATRGG